MTPETPPSKPHKPRVRVTARGVVVHDEHALFLKGRESNGRVWYVIPGGGVEHGETLEDALVREMREETGICVKVVRPLFVREFIPERHPGRSEAMPLRNHVVGLIFLCHLDQAQHANQSLAEIGHFPGHVDGTSAIVGMEWLPIAELDAFDIRPPHLRASFRDGPPQDQGAIIFWPEENPRP